MKTSSLSAVKIGNSLRIVRWMISVIGPTEYAAIALSLVVSFGIGAILGDLLGKLRNYKVSAQYSS